MLVLVDTRMGMRFRIGGQIVEGTVVGGEIYIEILEVQLVGEEVEGRVEEKWEGDGRPDLDLGLNLHEGSM